MGWDSLPLVIIFTPNNLSVHMSGKNVAKHASEFIPNGGQSKRRPHHFNMAQQAHQAPTPSFNLFTRK
jgi:hypothetical protein